MDLLALLTKINKHNNFNNRKHKHKRHSNITNYWYKLADPPIPLLSNHLYIRTILSKRRKNNYQKRKILLKVLLGTRPK